MQARYHLKQIAAFVKHLNGKFQIFDACRGRGEPISIAFVRKACNSSNGISRSELMSPICAKGLARRGLAGIAPGRDVPGGTAKLHCVVDGCSSLALDHIVVVVGGGPLRMRNFS